MEKQLALFSDDMICRDRDIIENHLALLFKGKRLQLGALDARTPGINEEKCQTGVRPGLIDGLGHTQNIIGNVGILHEQLGAVDAPAVRCSSSFRERVQIVAAAFGSGGANQHFSVGDCS